MPALQAADLRPFSVSRYSRRQDAWMPLEGITGRFELAGPLGLWAPILETAAALQMGGKTAFGFGCIEVRPTR